MAIDSASAVMAFFAAEAAKRFAGASGGEADDVQFPRLRSCPARSNAFRPFRREDEWWRLREVLLMEWKAVRIFPWLRWSSSAMLAACPCPAMDLQNTSSSRSRYEERVKRVSHSLNSSTPHIDGGPIAFDSLFHLANSFRDGQLLRRS